MGHVPASYYGAIWSDATRLIGIKCSTLCLHLPHLTPQLTSIPSQMSHNIPRTQKAAVVVSADAPISVRDDYPVKQPDELAPGECLVKMHCTGVCHTDLHARNGDWPLAHKLPLVGGHEGVGEIVAIGAHTTDSPVKVGDRVGVKWLAYSCLHCEQCRKGLEQSM